MSVSKVFNSLLIGIVGYAIIGCGSSDNEPVGMYGKVVDGYISNAKVCIDLNSNDSCDANEPYTYTDFGGKYIFSVANNIYAQYPKVAEIIKGVSVDSDEPQEKIGVSLNLIAPAGVNTISPLTTLIYFDMMVNNKSLDTAHQDLINYFGLDAYINLLIDYMEKESIDPNYAKVHAISKTAFKHMDSNTKRSDHEAIKQHTKTVHNSATRTITVKNQCSGNIGVQYVGAAANTVACTKDIDCTNFNPNLTGWKCYADPGVQGTFCHPPEANATLGDYNTTIHAVYCKTTECCNFFAYGSALSSAGPGQCFYSLDGKNATSNVVLTPQETKIFSFGNLNRQIVLSGKISFLNGCNSSADIQDNNCTTPQSLTSPTEFTLAGSPGNNDYYDVSLINGVAVPVMIKPEDNGTFTPVKTDPYWCGASGAPTGDSGIRSGLKNYGCTYQYENEFNSTSSGPGNIGYNFVTDSNTTCSSHSDCTTKGEVCGLSYSTVNSNGTQTTCGKRKGYWTYTGFCSVNSNSTYKNNNVGVDCSTYGTQALCPGVPSPWGVPSSCGCATWSDMNNTLLKGLPIDGYTNSQCHENDTWSTQIEPKVEKIKEGCPTAYSYQYDDPYSTFQCRSNSGTVNMINYEVIMCPSDANGKPIEAGINFN